MTDKERPLEWIGSSHRDLMALPPDVRRFFGYALSLAQAGDRHDAARLKAAQALAKELRDEKAAR